MKTNNIRTSTLLLLLPSLMFMTISCVSKKKYIEIDGIRTSLESRLNTCKDDLENCEDLVVDISNQLALTSSQLRNKESEYSNQIKRMEQELDFVKKNNSNLLERLSDLSVVTVAEAENVRKSLESLNEQNKYIRELTSKIQSKDSINLSLVMNLKRSLSNVNDNDVQVEVKKGVVYISLSDKLLFKSGSSRLNKRAEEVLGKVASVINDHKDLEIVVEGHTDNVPISTNCISDNWDLSVKRATAVVRVLEQTYEVNPSRISAAGRGEHVPKTSNENANGRSENRRTEIIITPKLDQFFKLFENAGTN